MEIKRELLVTATLLALSACAPITEMDFIFVNDCEQEINLDMKFQHDKDHDTQIWNNEVIGPHQRRETDATVADLDVFEITYWIWFEGYEYRSDTRYQQEDDRISTISVRYAYQEQLGACTLLEQAY